MRTSYIAIALVALLSSACAIGPNYHRPQVAVPASFRAPAPLPQADAASLADAKWFEVFHDEQLQELIRTALAQNYDVRDAAARVEQARANLRGTRSNQLPQVNATGAVEFTRISRGGQLPLDRKS